MGLRINQQPRPAVSSRLGHTCVVLSQAKGHIASGADVEPAVGLTVKNRNTWERALVELGGLEPPTFPMLSGRLPDEL